MNAEGAKQRRLWKRALESEDRAVRTRAMEDHAELLKRQLDAILAGEEAWFFDVELASSSSEEEKKEGGARRGKVNAVIAMAATMRIQCMVRRFISSRRVLALRVRKQKRVSATRIQKVWRGRKLREKLRKISSTNFEYVDDELGEMLDDEFDFAAFGIEDDGDGLGVSEDGSWKPTKPEPTAAPVEDAWATAEPEPQQVVEAKPPSREISSPFEGRGGKMKELNMMSANLRKNGFDFMPPGAGGAGRAGVEQDDMEIKSVRPARESGHLVGHLTLTLTPRCRSSLPPPTATDRKRTRGGPSPCPRPAARAARRRRRRRSWPTGASRTLAWRKP
jgi:hypothetical protein